MRTHDTQEALTPRRDTTRPTKTEEPKSARSSPPPRTPDAHDRSKGLCVSCLHRDECTYPTPEGGVWNCEEYE